MSNNYPILEFVLLYSCLARWELGSLGLPHSGDWLSVFVINCSTHRCARWNLHTFDNFELKYFKVSQNSIVVKLIKMLWLWEQMLFPQPTDLRRSFPTSTCLSYQMYSQSSNRWKHQFLVSMPKSKFQLFLAVQNSSIGDLVCPLLAWLVWHH